MSGRDYYVVLGVSRNTSTRGIREAYIELAKHYHPDRAGPKATGYFQEIAEAYRVLSDQRRRALYDRGLCHGEERDDPTPEPRVVPPRTEPEPLAPRGPTMGEPMRMEHSFGALFESLLDQFVGRGLSRSRRLTPVDIDLFLSPTEAFRGGRLPLEVPVLYPCPSCRGRSRGWAAGCAVCAGAGMVRRWEANNLPIPPGVQDGAVVECPVRGLGINNFVLRLHVKVRH